MRITFVKKIKADGSPCKKCAEVQSRLENDGLIDKIDRTVIADERDDPLGLCSSGVNREQLDPLLFIPRPGAGELTEILF